MADLNKVFLMGSLTADPELRRTPSGSAVTELRVVTSRTWTGRDGDRREEKLYIDVTVWDRQAENCCQFLRRGSGIHVEGYLKMDTWDDKNTGEKRSKIRIQAERVQFLDSRRSDGSGSPGGMGADDEMDAPPARDPAPGAVAPPRRAGRPAATASRAGRSTARSASYPPPGPSGPAPIDDEHAEDDIPF